MKNLLQTGSIAWAQGARVALEAEGIRAVVLDEHDRGGMGVWGRVRVAVLNDEHFEKAQAIVARLTPPRTDPPASWRLQRRGLLLLLVDLPLWVAWMYLLQDFQDERNRIKLIAVVALGAVVGIFFIAGVLLIILGPRADKPGKGAS